jgi:hypothetical protein
MNKKKLKKDIKECIKHCKKHHLDGIVSIPEYWAAISAYRNVLKLLKKKV